MVFEKDLYVVSIEKILFAKKNISNYDVITKTDKLTLKMLTHQSKADATATVRISSH